MSSARPGWVYRLLMAWSARRPARVIFINREPYLERYYLGTVFGFTAYLHRFLSCDGDRAPHNHPWAFSVGVPLTGGYVEERITRLDAELGWHLRLRRIRRARPNFIFGHTFHRIAELDPGTWTLFVHGRRHAGWGFLRAELVDAEGTAVGMRVLFEPAVGRLDYEAHERAWWQDAPNGLDMRATIPTLVRLRQETSDIKDGLSRCRAWRRAQAEERANVK